MCKIIRYWYTCTHSSRLRRSKCGGTKHKKSRSGPTPACKSEPYLSISVPVDCGSCQHLAFEERWRRKLFRAAMFLDTVKDEGLPGVQEVTALIEQLKDECSAATWDTRLLFPHAHKDCAGRISLGHFVRAPSPLRHELFYDDVCEPPGDVNPGHQRLEYDWDYVASTDPMHPVDTNYAHPLDDVDPSWMLDHLSSEEFEQTGCGVGFDQDEVGMLWSVTVEESYSDTASWVESSDSWSSGTEAQVSGQSSEVLSGQSSAGPAVETSVGQDEARAECIDMITDEFWCLVNDDLNQDHPQGHTASTSKPDLLVRMNSLHIPDPSDLHDTSLTTPPSTQPTPLRSRSSSPDRFEPSAASSMDTHISPPHATTALEDHHIRIADVPSSNRTCGPYNRLRQHLIKTKSADVEKFYRCWLELSRCEIRDVEAGNGRFVQDPQVPRQLGVGNGWWK